MTRKLARFTAGVVIVTSAIALYSTCTLYSSFQTLVYRNASVTQRGRVHLNALLAYVEQHEALPPMLISSASRSELLRYAGQSFDAPEQEVTSPQYIFPLYDEGGRWLVSLSKPREPKAAFAQILAGIEGNHVVIVKRSGTFLRSEKGEHAVSLAGAQLILFSNETIWIPENLTAQQVANFIMKQ